MKRVKSLLILSDSSPNLSHKLPVINTKPTNETKEMSKEMKAAMDDFSKFLKSKTTKDKMNKKPKDKIKELFQNPRELKAKEYVLYKNGMLETDKPFTLPKIRSSSVPIDKSPILSINSEGEKIKKKEEIIKRKKKKESSVFWKMKKYAKSNGCDTITDFLQSLSSLEPYSMKYGEEFIQAVIQNQEKVVEDSIKTNPELLLEHDYLYQTPYHWAAKLGHDKLLKLMIKHGKFFNLYDLKKRTPLYFASMYGRKECVKVLLDNGVNVDFPDINGVYPNQIAYTKEIKLMIERQPKIEEINKKFSDVFYSIVNNKKIKSALQMEVIKRQQQLKEEREQKDKEEQQVEKQLAILQEEQKRNQNKRDDFNKTKKTFREKTNQSKHSEEGGIHLQRKKKTVNTSSHLDE